MLIDDTHKSSLWNCFNLWCNETTNVRCCRLTTDVPSGDIDVSFTYQLSSQEKNPWHVLEMLYYTAWSKVRNEQNWQNWCIFVGVGDNEKIENCCWMVFDHSFFKQCPFSTHHITSLCNPTPYETNNYTIPYHVYESHYVTNLQKVQFFLERVSPK